MVHWLTREPSYEGKPLSYWLERAGSGNHDRETAETATHAVKQIGPRAVPSLLKLLYEENPFWHEWVDKVPGLKDLSADDAAARANQTAIRGFAILGDDAQSALPYLARMLAQTGTTERAAWALANIGTIGEPLLLSAVTNSQP